MLQGFTSQKKAYNEFNGDGAGFNIQNLGPKNQL
jgi:hypothetical protein